jgi:FtsH-binding integral membrane protein
MSGVLRFIQIYPWLVYPAYLVIGLPIFVAVEWLRRRRAGARPAVFWCFISSFVLACVITPVCDFDHFRLLHIYPAIVFVDNGLFWMISGKDSTLGLNLFFYGLVRIVAVSAIFFVVWMFFRSFNKRQRK